MAPILGYWGFRGLAEPIRYLLYYKGVEFEDKRYANPEVWAKAKFNLGLQFPNLPYYIDGDFKLTQSSAILRYLARKYGLVAKTEEERAIEEMIEQQVVDMRMSLFIAVFYKPDFEKAKLELIQSAPNALKSMSDLLGNKKFLTGDKISYVDFMAYDVFEFTEYFHPPLYNDFPSLRAYMRQFQSLPELQKYFKSGTYKRWPIFNPVAKFGGSGEEPKK